MKIEYENTEIVGKRNITKINIKTRLNYRKLYKAKVSHMYIS